MAKLKQLPRSLTNSLTAMTKKELSQLGFSQEAGSKLPYKMPESLFSAKHTEAGPCGQQ